MSTYDTMDWYLLLQYIHPTLDGDLNPSVIKPIEDILDKLNISAEVINKREADTKNKKELVALRDFVRQSKGTSNKCGKYGHKGVPYLP